MKSHDKLGRGFNVSKEQLAHDLTLLKMSKMKDINESSANVFVYNTYTSLIDQFTSLIEDQTRYDSSFQK